MKVLWKCGMVVEDFEGVFEMFVILLFIFVVILCIIIEDEFILSFEE